MTQNYYTGNLNDLNEIPEEGLMLKKSFKFITRENLNDYSYNKIKYTHLYYTIKDDAKEEFDFLIRMGLDINIPMLIHRDSLYINYSQLLYAICASSTDDEYYIKKLYDLGCRFNPVHNPIYAGNNEIYHLLKILISKNYINIFDQMLKWKECREIFDLYENDFINYANNEKKYKILNYIKKKVLSEIIYDFINIPYANIYKDIINYIF